MILFQHIASGSKGLEQYAQREFVGRSWCSRVRAGESSQSTAWARWLNPDSPHQPSGPSVATEADSSPAAIGAAVCSADADMPVSMITDEPTAPFHELASPDLHCHSRCELTSARSSAGLSSAITRFIPSNPDCLAVGEMGDQFLRRPLAATALPQCLLPRQSSGCGAETLACGPRAIDPIVMRLVHPIFR